MIRYVSKGDIRDDPSDILVCAVCCVPGVMGAGQAKAFRQRWPSLVQAHRECVKMGDLRIGHGAMLWTRIYGLRPSGMSLGHYLFPTKDHWRKPSRLEWVADGFRSLVGQLQETIRATEAHMELCRNPKCDARMISSIALPAVGCGLGGLTWEQVRPLIELAELQVPEITWTVYEPGAER